jgi:hypothetical protein
MKKIFILTIIVVLSFSIFSISFADSNDELTLKNVSISSTDSNDELTLKNVSISSTDSNDELTLKNEYDKILNYAKNNNIKLDMTYEQFIKNYKESNYKNIEEYSKSYYSILNPQLESNDKGRDAWYYNISTYLPNNAEPDYSKYNLLDTVEVGDIIYEKNGFYGLTGHIAIIEGIYTQHNKTYIRIVEAIGDGVVRSVLDDTRVDDQKVSIYRVDDASAYNKYKALQFCINQIGDAYSLDLAKDTSSSEIDWYCSELVWAGYFNRGYDIETDGYLNEPGITPRDIKRCDDLTYINFK